MNPYSGRNAPRPKDLKSRGLLSAPGFPVVGNGLGGLPAREWSPKSLFSGGFDGFIFDSSAGDYLFQDVFCTIPATVGKTVQCIKDLSGNNRHAVQPNISYAPVLRNSDGLWYLEFDNNFTNHLYGSFGSAISQGDVTLGASFNRSAVATWQQVIFMGYTTDGNEAQNGRGVPSIAYRTTGNEFGMHNSWVFDTGVFVDHASHSTNTDWTAILTRSGGTAGNGGLIDLRTSRTTEALSDTGTQSWNSDPSSLFTIGVQDYDFTATQAFSGRIYAAIVLSRAISEYERLLLNKWLAKKAGILL